MKLRLTLFFLLITGITWAQTSNGAYYNVLKIPNLDSSPAYFYINTNIPATDVAAPQLQITGYMYGNATHKAMKITLGWYYFDRNFFWSQFNNDFGYQKPSRIRLGKYSKNGTDFIRIEISNNAVYWSNYTVSATDRADFYAYYQGWTYNEGEMPAETTQVITVGQPASTSIDGNLGIGILNPAEKLSVNGNIRAKEIKVETANWPDYVFEKDYKKLSLAELEKFIQLNKHLPEMPSAGTIESNGLALGDMVKLQQKKIEELTLYLIDQKELLNLQKDRLEMQQRQLEIISKELKGIKNTKK